jgi:putative flippase GtrA
MLKKLWEKRLARFMCAGVFNTLFDTSILNVLVFVGHLPLLLANLISASISMTTSYFLNHHLVFRSRQHHSLSQFARFFAVTGIGILGIQSLVIYGVTHFLHYQHMAVVDVVAALPFKHLTVAIFDLNVAKILAVLTAMIWNFALYRLIIFKKPNTPPDEEVLL